MKRPAILLTLALTLSAATGTSGCAHQITNQELALGAISVGTVVLLLLATQCGPECHH